jgi:hypothetical protein
MVDTGDLDILGCSSIPDITLAVSLIVESTDTEGFPDFKTTAPIYYAIVADIAL